MSYKVINIVSKYKPKNIESYPVNLGYFDCSFIWSKHGFFLFDYEAILIKNISKNNSYAILNIRNDKLIISELCKEVIIERNKIKIIDI